MKALFDMDGRCIAVGDGDGFEDAMPLPKGAKSTLALRYVLQDGKVKDRFAGMSDEEATAAFEAEQRELAAQQQTPANPQPAPRPISKLEFMERFTDEELAAIYAAAKTDVRVEVWMDKMKLASEIDLADPRTRAGVEALETLGLIGQGRAAEVLS